MASAMRAQVDDDGHPRFTSDQVIAALHAPVSRVTLNRYAPDPWRRGGWTLDQVQIEEIRAKHEEHDEVTGKRRYTQTQLAAAYGVTPATISRLLRDISSRGTQRTKAPAPGVRRAGRPRHTGMTPADPGA